MGIKLHNKCKERLVEVIAEQLPNLSVNNRMFLDGRSAMPLLLAEKVIPNQGGIREKLNQYISESPIFDFVYESLSKELYERQEYDPETKELKLIEIEGYENPRLTAKRLVDEFDTLPWKYSFTIKFGNELSTLFADLIGCYQLSDSLRLIRPNEDFEKSYPLRSGIEARDRSLFGELGLPSMFSPPQWDRSSSYLQIEADGFVGKYGETYTVERAKSTLKSFCGLGIALRLFKINYKYRPTPPKAKFFVHREIDKRWIVDSAKKLDSDISSTFNDLVFHDFNGQLDTNSKKSTWAKARLKEIKSVFSNSEKAEKIRLASQWLFDSHSGKNELLSFVQTVVALEILLGEKAVSDQIGIGELLGNRCAYLIGKSHSQRSEILDDFKEIYGIRSKIVHRGKSRLTYRERELFSKLQRMCHRVIQEELKLLQEDLRKMHNNRSNTRTSNPL